MIRAKFTALVSTVRQVYRQFPEYDGLVSA